MTGGQGRSFCCEAFTNKVGSLRSGNGQFVPDEGGAWCINGCCGGGCYVVTEMRFCPFCGTKLPLE